MITDRNNVLRLTTTHTSYWFRITDFGHLEHIYYGVRLEEQQIDPLLLKRTATIGSSIVYNESDPLYVLDNVCLEWSGIGRGDFRYSPSELKMPDGSFVNDFVYQSHRIFDGIAKMATLPSAQGDDSNCQTLEITLCDQSNKVWLLLYYTVYEACDVITRRAVLENRSNTPLTIRRLLSLMVDFPNQDFQMVTFDGSWIKEAHKHDRPITYGMLVNSSTTGASSNRHNPGFLVARNNATQDTGEVYGFNLIYSGNHFSFAELSPYDLVRIGIGINPHCFEWNLEKGSSFETPEAVMTFSNQGFNGTSHHFHDFINEHIVRGDWKGQERPVLLNNWEAHFFKFTRGKLLRLAKQAKGLGVELFVLDDGWFGERNNDNAGLGDYTVNRKKLPRGMKHFAGQIRKLGLQFGLWFEPEMVNEDSDLYRSHPEYAITLPGKTPTLGRNQLVLDLCNKEVRDYIVDSVTKVLDEADITYVKWDMNRHISELYSPYIPNQGEFFHRYILGLYDILTRIFFPRPHILLESCSSGGNRFDLGMLCFSPQIWASDNTDPIERLSIQGGLSYLYPLSTMGAHVSEAPHQQTLRPTPLATRFNTACFGCLGYELDLKYLSAVEKKEIKEQIAFYKEHRKTFQYGRFDRLEANRDNQIHWQCMDDSQKNAIVGLFQTLAKAASGHSFLRIKHLKEDVTYRVETKAQRLFVKRFGGLVKHILPIELNPNGFILRVANRFYALCDCVEQYEGDGRLLSQGILLNNQFMGSYYNEQTELLGDYGSYLFVVKQTKEKMGE